MPWADHTDITDLWIAPPAAPTGVDEQMDALAVIAEYRIKRVYPGIQDRIDDDDAELGELAKYVVVQMVQSLYQNPQGLQYFQQQSGPFMRSGNYAAGATVLMNLSDEQKDLLAPSRTGKAFSINLDPNRDETTAYLTSDVIIN